MKKQRLPLAILAGLLLGGSLHGESYIVTRLGALGGNAGDPSGRGSSAAINNSGQIVGSTSPQPASIGILHATLFSGTGAGNIPLGSLGGSDDRNCAAYDINSSGQIVGFAFTADAKIYHATLFGGGGSGNTDLGTLGGRNSVAHGINDSGQIVGYAFIAANNASHATLFSGSGKDNIDLGTLGGPNSKAYGINNSGQIAGYADTAVDKIFHATLFGASGKDNIDLGTLGGPNSKAYGINSSGQIVGAADTTDGTSRATLFSGSGSGNTDLGTLGGRHSIAYGINNSGQIVGNSEAIGTSTNHGFLYSNGSMTDLNSLVRGGSGLSEIRIGGEIPAISFGNHINDWGQIAAIGNHIKQTEAVLLNPINPLITTTASSQDVKLVKGMSYSKATTFTNSTADRTRVSFLDGTATANRDVSVLALPPVNDLASDAIALNITTPGNNSTRDLFVVQLSYNETFVKAHGGAAKAYLGYLDPSDNIWKSAVLGNSDGGASTHSVSGAYDAASDFHLGYHGVDTVNNVVWAVIDHNGTLGAAITGISPAPPKPSPSATPRKRD